MIKEDVDPPQSLVRFEQVQYPISLLFISSTRFDTLSHTKEGYAISVVQNLSVTFVKLSILFFYNRVFSNGILFLSISLMVVRIYVNFVGIGSIIEFIVHCLPIRYASRERTT